MICTKPHCAILARTEIPACYLSGFLSSLFVDGAHFKVKEKDLHTNKTTSTEINWLKGKRDHFLYHRPREYQWHEVKKHLTEKIKHFCLEVVIPQDHLHEVVTLSEPLLMIKLSHSHFNKEEWVEIKVAVTEFHITGNKILDKWHPKLFVPMNALRTGFVWHYKRGRSKNDDGLILYHKPEHEESSVQLSVNMVKYNKICSDLTAYRAFPPCVVWQSDFTFTPQTQVHVISLPGQVQKIRVTSAGHTNLPSPGVLHAYWTKEICPFKRDKDCKEFSLCEKDLYKEVHKVFNLTHKFHYVHLLQHFCKKSDLTSNDTFKHLLWFDLDLSMVLDGTWNEAFQLCKAQNGTLPIIRNNQELDQIITMCKCDLTSLGIMFIGLRNNPAQKVSSYFLVLKMIEVFE